MSSDFGILGELEVRQDGDLIEFGSPRQRALLARLLISPREVVTTDRLVEDLWRGDPPKTARHMLHVYVSRLRIALGDDGAKLERHGAGYRFSIEPDELDASRFEQLATEGKAALARHDADGASVQLQQALSMWRGSALTEFTEEAFAREEAVRLDELRLSALEQQAWADLELGRHRDMVEKLQDLVAQHPLRETFSEQLMVALYRSGRQADALRVYQTARANLAGELGIEPGPALRRIEERILAQDPTLEQTPAVTDSTPNEMPLQRTSFVGRERELAQGVELLERSRLLTLTGAPGSGKTRLALRLAANRRSDFPHGSFFVPLAAITDPRLMDSAMARMLGLREVQGETVLDGIKAFLRDRRVLLILDNFEQVLGAAPHVGELLDATPGLTIMVTSRAPLGLTGEQEFPVPPLNLPPVDDLPDLEALTTYDAVALFVARARAADPNFALDTGNAVAVAEITARLEGLPLAIELAAARVKLLTPQDLLSRLQQRLILLTGGPADSVDRHRTMRDAIAWSYELLEPEEQALFRRLGVFRGGFTLEAATAVVDLPDLNVFDGVDSLHSKSLLHRPVHVGQARFAMLEMMREFALEQLDSAGEKEEVAKRHAHYFCHVAETTEPELTRETQRTAIGLLSQELDNIRGALRFALGADDPDLGLNLASCIWRFWQSTGQLSEGRQWLENLLASQGASDQARAKGLSGLAGLTYWQGNYGEALTRYEEALDLYRAVGDRFKEAETLFGMSMAASWNGDPDTGGRLAGEARSIFEGLGAKEGIGKVNMAQAFSLHRKGDHAAARPLWKAALGISRELGDQHLAVTQLIGLAMYVFEDGDVGEALSIALEAANEATDAENVQLAIWMLDFVAAFAASAAPEGAVRLAGAVEALRQVAGGGMPLAPLDLEDARSVAARVLSPESLDQALAEGRAMTLDQAVEYAKELERLVLGLSTS
jgi:predicted ATPase/DNA-binding SARP family transcriptional activator